MLVGVTAVLFQGKLNTVMIKTVRVALTFATYSKDELNSFAILVIACLKTNPLFPNLPITVAALTALQMAYQNAMGAAALGGPKDTAAMQEARDTLVVALRQIAAYIQSLTLTESQVLTSGFDGGVWGRSKVALDAPASVSLDNSISGQLGVFLQAVPGAKAYHVQYCTGTGSWLDVGIWPNTKGIVIPNLTPGTVYSVRIRAVGGSTQYSPWSTAVSLMAT